jgi:hypothetical protein
MRGGWPARLDSETGIPFKQKKDVRYQYVETSLGKAWPENHLRRNQAGVCDQARLLWAKEDIQGGEGQRN